MYMIAASFVMRAWRTLRIWYRQVLCLTKASSHRSWLESGGVAFGHRLRKDWQNGYLITGADWLVGLTHFAYLAPLL